MNSDENDNRKLIEALAQSSVFRDFERSFTEATGLAVALVPVQSWRLTFNGHHQENNFCALLSSCPRACAACLATQEKLTASATHAAQTITCPAGLCETAVPVWVGNQLVGFLRTGQVFRATPSQKQFQHLKRLARSWKLPLDEEALRTAYLRTPFFAAKRYDAMIRLLNIFAQHLGVVSNELLLRRTDVHTEPPIITRARAFIEEHFTEQITLRQAAAASYVSPFHFCKVFKRVTGLTFTVFVARLRIEKAKDLLMNPNYRISEIGYAVGFESLTHFNRRFSQFAGESPTSYRQRVQHTLAAGHATWVKSRSSGDDTFGGPSKTANQSSVKPGMYSGKTTRAARDEFLMPVLPAGRAWESE